MPKLRYSRQPQALLLFVHISAGLLEQDIKMAATKRWFLPPTLIGRSSLQQTDPMPLRQSLQFHYTIIEILHPAPTPVPWFRSEFTSFPHGTSLEAESREVHPRSRRQAWQIQNMALLCTCKVLQLVNADIYKWTCSLSLPSGFSSFINTFKIFQGYFRACSGRRYPIITISPSPPYYYYFSLLLPCSLFSLWFLPLPFRHPFTFLKNYSQTLWRYLHPVMPC